MSVDLPDVVSLTSELVRTPSVNPVLEDGGSGEGAIADLAASWLEGWGYQVAVPEVSPGRYNVVARTGPSGGPSLLLNGHLDTVGVTSMTSPFSGEVRGGRLHGRGSCDMKAGVAAALATAATMAREELGGELIIALTADEEHASLGMQDLVESGVRADAAVVCEPTDLHIMPAHKGFLWADLLVKGKAAHGSRPDVGVDAIVHAGSVLRALAEEAHRLTQRSPHPLLGHASIHAGTISGGSAPSVYPEECRIVVERRTLPGEAPAALMEELEAMLGRARQELPALDVRAEEGLFRPGTEVATASELVRALSQSCREHGLEPVLDGMTAWVDASFLNENGTPALCFGPGSIALAHTADEWVPTDQIRRCQAVLTGLARRFLRATPR